MRTYQRLTAVAAMAVMAVTVTACGGTDTAAPRASAPTAAATSSAAPASDGVTTPADVFGAACSQLPQGNSPGSLASMGPQPVATAASTNPLLSTLVTAVKAAGLAETLNSQQAITVFAPYNPAFDEVKKALGDAKFNALLADKEGLGNVLKYHVVAERLDRKGLTDKGSVATLGGGNLTIKDTGSTITVTDGSGATANVLCGNIPTSNATVFVIDKVLMPASTQ